MTHSPKNPTRAEALAALKKLHPKHGVVVTDEQYKQYETDCSVFVILNYDLLEAALATDAPIIEGLDEAIKKVEAHFRDEDGTVYGWVKPVTDAARLYAQGRTQSVYPDLDMDQMLYRSDKLGFWLSAALDDPNVCQEMKDDINSWFNSLQPYTPPVTAPIEKVDGLAEAVKQELSDYKKLVSEDDHSMTIVAKDDLEKLRDFLSKIQHEVDERECQWFWRRRWISKYTREALALLLATPSARLQLQRQGD